MGRNWNIFLVFLFVALILLKISFHSVQANYYQQQEYAQNSYNYQVNYSYPYHDSRIVDSQGKYILEWTADHSSKIITFNLTVRTTGWVGLGFSKKGEMREADMVVAGVGPNGQYYLRDLYTDSYRKIFADAQQSYQMLSSSEHDGITNLIIARPFDTCDSSDYAITMDLLSVIWAYGETDQYDYHYDKRGSFRVYLLDPVITPPETDLELARFSMQLTLPPKVTTYWCKIVKGPELETKRHIVRTGVYLQDQKALDHTHHILLWRCVAPPGQDPQDVFEPFVTHPGEECIFTEEHQLPFLFCRMLVAGWSIGGRDLNIPYSTGIPIGENPNEYYILEIHFNNPEKVSVLTVTAGMDTYHTGQLRENEGGRILMPAHDNFGLLMVPPISPSFDIFGFCSIECTKTMIPPEGVEILTALIHSHNSGRKATIHHFRNGYELPWIMKDDNYDNTFQQQRVLHQPRLVLPGDLLVMRCTYDNTWTNTTTVSGFSTSEEMCSGSLYITKRIPYSACNSQVPQGTLLPVIGLEHVEWDVHSELRVITKPTGEKGKFLKTVTDIELDWTKALRYKLQDVTLQREHIGTCPEILIPSPATTSSSSSTSSTDEQQVQVEAAMESLRGKVFSSTADSGNIMQQSKRYGVETLMGEETGVPIRTPGPVSRAIYPTSVKPYQEPRYCSRAAAAYSTPAAYSNIVSVANYG